MRASDVTTRLKRPEYTGENRCLPCTVVNAVLSVVLGVVLSVVLTPLVGILGVLAALVVIYLRGYLVPGTPELTKRYFPPWLLRLFGKEPMEAVDVGRRSTAADVSPGEATDADEPTRNGDQATDADPLVAAGVVSADDARLTPAFHDAWLDRASTRATDGVTEGDVATAFGAAEARRTSDTSFVLDGSKSVHWGSQAAIAADVAAAALLDDRLDDWAASDRDRRQSLLLGLRLGLRQCPACGGDVDLSEHRVDPCCERPHLVADLVCSACGAPLADAAVVDDGSTESVRARLLAG